MYSRRLATFSRASMTASRARFFGSCDELVQAAFYGAVRFCSLPVRVRVHAFQPRVHEAKHVSVDEPLSHGVFFCLIVRPRCKVLIMG